jgi:hypothetical protein
MKLQYFNGGLSTRFAPNLIEINEGVEYENIDNSVGVLAPVKSKTDTLIAIDKFAYHYLAKDEWVSSGTDRDYIEYQEKLYYSEAGSYPKRYDGTVETRLGIIAPTTAPIIDSVETQPLPPTGATLTQTALGNINTQEDNGTQRTLKYYLVNLGTNGLASTTFSKSITLTGATSSGSVTISAVVGRINETYVYRYHLGVYRYVGKLTGAITSITDAAFNIEAYDAYAEVGLTGTYQYVLTYYNGTDDSESMPSPLSTEVVVAGGLCKLTNLPVSSDPQVTARYLYRIGGNLTEFTRVDTLDLTTTSYDDPVKDSEISGEILDSTYNNEAATGISFLTEAYGILFGALGDKLYFSRLGYPAAWPSTNYIDFDAPITGIGVVSAGMIIFTATKSYIVVGTNTGTFIQYPLGGDQGCVNHKSVKRLKGSILWVSTDGICTTSGSETVVISKPKLGKITLDVVNAVVHEEVYYVQLTSGKILAFDTGYGAIYKHLDLGVDYLYVANDVLYGHHLGELYSLQTSTSVEPITFLSPKFTEGEYCNRKTYKHFYMRSEGDLVISIIIDDAIVSTQTVSTTDTHDLIVPQEAQNGYSVQFRVTGTGTVHELQYTVMERQNGR